VRDAIHRFAQTISAGSSVLVTEATTVSWSGLNPVEEQKATEG
jgi:mRNA degradation ribonuclease J1/J2